MSRNVCVLNQSEADGLFNGVIPDCQQHPHMRKRRAGAEAKGPIPRVRWIGKNRVVRLPGQRTWRVQKTVTGETQWQFVP
jgi:hypothetical protein